MNNARHDIGAEEVVRALLNDASFGFERKGDYLRKGRCPSCGKRELFVSTDKPWNVKCSRENNCGWESTTRELLPELFEEFSERYAATEQEPDKTASAYMQMNRGFDYSIIKGWFTQGMYPLPGSNRYLNTVRFSLTPDDSVTWERFIDKRPSDGRKANFKGKNKGLAWTPPKFSLEKGEKCFLVEGIFHAIALAHIKIKAAACMSSVNFPSQLVEENKGNEIIWVLALDGDEAGRKWTRKHAKTLKDMGEKVEVLTLPDNGMDWDDYFRANKLTSSFISERLYHGKLFMAENVHEKAYHMYLRKQYGTFTLDFANALYSIEVDRAKLEVELNPSKKDDNEGEPNPIRLDSSEGWNIFMRNHEVDPLSNTLPRFLYMEIDEIMGEQFYVFQIHYANGSPSDIIRMEGTNLASPEAFHKTLLNKTRGGTFDGDFKQLKILRDRWLGKRMKMVSSIPFVGYDDNTKAYVFQDHAFYKGRELKLNRDGYFQVGQNGIKSSLLGTHITTDGEFSPDWLDKYITAFHFQGMVLLAFWLGSLFAQQIREMHKSYPFLEYTGEPGAGKSTSLEFLWACCGRDDHEGFDIMKATVAGRRRAMNQVSNMPVVIIESDRDDGNKDAKAKQFDFDLCKPFFNGRGTGTLGISKRGNDVEESPFRAALIISQNAEVDGSEALLQRIVHVHVDKRHHKPGSREIARWFERQNSSTVGGFLRKALQNERQILTVYEEAFHKYEAEFGKSDKIRNERIVKNHAQVAAMGAALSVLFPAWSEDRQAKLAEYILGRAEAREQRLAADHPIIEQFWETYQYINNSRTDETDEFLNHSNKEEQIAVNLNQYREACLKLGQELPDMAQLKKLLKNGKRHKLIDTGKNVSSRWMKVKGEPSPDGKNRMKPKILNCWIFKR
ncbi:toprim domain-containing protein [Pseudodesulfovibrio sp.]|uniref:toprim domain-containing protein n=1 Tax=unclassified Pseudodesulfovibrio TaxID=2661612 RepID=UPI003B0089F9